MNNNISRTRIYGSFPKWERVPVPKGFSNGPSWNTQVSEAWKCTTKNRLISCTVRDLCTSKFGHMRHIVTKFIDRELLKKNDDSAFFNSLDPSYNEKLAVLMVVGKWKVAALEVFPKRSNLVDHANLYHIWEVQSADASSLPFDPSYIKQAPDIFTEESRGKNYSVEYELVGKRCSSGIVGYLYLRSMDKKELKWRQKQQIKDDLIGEDMIAVEVISDEFKNLDYTCLVCFPINYKLDFGISNEETGK